MDLYHSEERQMTDKGILLALNVFRLASSFTNEYIMILKHRNDPHQSYACLLSKNAERNLKCKLPQWDVY